MNGNQNIKGNVFFLFVIFPLLEQTDGEFFYYGGHCLSWRFYKICRREISSAQYVYGLNNHELSTLDGQKPPDIIRENCFSKILKETFGYGKLLWALHQDAKTHFEHPPDVIFFLFPLT